MDKPLTYLNSSLAIEYYVAEGVEYPKDTQHEELEVNERPDHKYLRQLLKSDKRYKLAKQMRISVNDDCSKVIFVVSPLVWLEMNEWLPGDRIQNESVCVAGLKYVQRKGRKDIGDLLSKVLSAARTGEDESALSLYRSTIDHPSYMAGEGLRGVEKRELQNFSISGEDMSHALNLACVQIGLADILHLLVAKFYSCSYFATLDSDFSRGKQIIEDNFGMKLLVGREVEEVL